MLEANEIVETILNHLMHCITEIELEPRKKPYAYRNIL